MILENIIRKLNQRVTEANRAVANEERGFTLIEMLIVMAVIALIGTTVTLNVMGKFERAKADQTRIQMRQLGVILDDFRRECGFYPTTDQGLEALIRKPDGRECKNYDPEGYIKQGKVPTDGWDTQFVYLSEGRSYELISLGADNAEGGEGLDADISSKEID